MLPNPNWNNGPPDLSLHAASILERVAEAFIVVDREWRIVYANREACRINQKPLEEFAGKIHWEEWPGAVGTEMERQFRRAMDEGEEAHFEHQYVFGPYNVWLDIDVYPFGDGISLFYRDITERKKAEAALQASAARFREMANALPHIAWTTQPDGSVDYLNQGWYDYSGLSFDETRDLGWTTVFHPDDLERARGVWIAAVEAGVPSELEYRLRRADGEYRWHLARSRPVHEDGELVKWVGTATDIEDRRRAEEALRQSQEDLELALGAAKLGTFYCEWPFDKIVWNPACNEHFFLPPDADVNFDLFYALLHPDDREPTRDAIARAAAERVQYNVEYRAVAPDGRTRWINAIGRVSYKSDGTPLRFDGITIDISERRRVEAEMAALYEREHRIAESLQRSLLNKPSANTLGAMEVEMLYQPALDEADVGGDYHDCFALDGGRLALVVGDVSGKGLQAASRTAEIKFTLRAYLREYAQTGPALSRLNAFLCEAQLLEAGVSEGDYRDYFVCVTLAVINPATGAMELAVAGAEPPLILRAGGGFEEARAGGMPLGIAPKAMYEADLTHLEPGDLLLMATDGITEARQGNDFLGNSGLAELARQAQGRAALAETGQAILDGARAFARGEQHDDVCLLLARR
jgi:PAS domain S-box-containing protein